MLNAGPCAISTVLAFGRLLKAQNVSLVFKMRKLMLEIRSVWNCRASQPFQGLSAAEIALLSFVTQLRRSIVGWGMSTLCSAKLEQTWVFQLIRAFLQMLC